ncbi:23S rRNA (uracil(1939)-C(5))-methyltransferase RlmD, partial [Candidatus Gracilibacteria bacterium]|nr:23S rRNA (uracil(1939)-C(5))-methyltransferase RlmD [Candidatus Gracilibacteria bacterium]
TNPYGMSGGWKWINIPYEEQLKIKQEQVKESLEYLKKYQTNIANLFSPILASPQIDGYRNKVEFSFGKYISAKEEVEKHFQVGFHKQGEFSKIDDMQGCPLIDEEQNEIYREIKTFSKTLGLPVYDQKTGKGFFRHIMIRKTYFSNQAMILLGFHPGYLKNHPEINSNEIFDTIKDFFQTLANKYPIITSIYLSHNANKADICIGDLECIYGSETITEKLHDLEFQISPTSFFQTNSAGAQLLYDQVIQMADIHTLPSQTVLDLYGGTGTIGMIFAKKGAQKVYSVELVTSASQDGEKNATKNNLENIEFINAKVEDFLGNFLSQGHTADLLIIDPPRSGMHPKALEDILKFGTKNMIYVSCNPATLARDCEYILQNSSYNIIQIQAVDMFPHTHHIETIVLLENMNNNY